MKRNLILVFVCLLILVGVRPEGNLSSQTPLTIYVDGSDYRSFQDGSQDNPYRTITAAIDNAYSWDTILVAAGTYHENIDFKNKAITLKSIFGPQKTIIHGSGAGDVVIGATGSTIEGFTITGSGDSWYDCGIYSLFSTMTIRGNIITGNWAGIATANYHTPLIVNNIIHHNMHIGISAQYYSAPVIMNNTIAFNGEDGISSYSGTGSVVNNIIYANGRCGIFCSLPASSPRIRYNNIFGNVMKDILGSTPEEGNIAADPQFEDARNGDYHLRPSSPCIEAGILELHVPPADLEGNPRPSPSGPFPDIGACEFPYICSPLSVTLMITRNRVVSGFSCLHVLSWQSNPKNEGQDIQKYRVYEIEGVRKMLLAELDVYTFNYVHRVTFWDAVREYAVCAVNSADREGPLAFVSVR